MALAVIAGSIGLSVAALLMVGVVVSLRQVDR